MLEGTRAPEVGPPSTFSTEAPSPRFGIPRTSKEIRELAKRLAYAIVSGYVEHDRGHLDASVEGFYQVYLHLFDGISPLRAHRAAELYVDALVKQDEIENHVGHGEAQIVADPRWNEVKSSLLELSRMLDLPEAYADETTDFFRYHGVGDRRYVHNCLESDRILSRKILGNDYWAKILGALLFIMTDCHDKHDSSGLEAGTQFATKYFEIILRAKAERVRPIPRPIL